MIDAHAPSPRGRRWPWAAGGLAPWLKRWLMGSLAALHPALWAADPPPPLPPGSQTQTITLVIPFSADGPTDRIGRDLAQALQAVLRQPVRTENYSGEGGTLGSEKVAKSPADGRTLLLTHINMATAPSLIPALPYDPIKDFIPLGLINEAPMIIVTRPDLPAQNASDFLQWLRHNAPTAIMAHAGLGSASHVCGMLLQSALQKSVRTISFRGTRPATPDLIEGHVDLMCDQSTDTLEHIFAGRLRAYAVTTAQRLEGPLATLPTLREIGLPRVELSIWHGLYAPKNTPPAVIARLNQALRTVLATPDFQRRQVALGARTVTDERATPEGHQAFVKAEIKRFAPIIEQSRTYSH